MQQVDYIIVGLGIAGALLSQKLLSKGHSIIVIDDNNPSSASKVSSGIINPITGRRLVKSWMYDQLEESFISAYRNIEKVYNTQILAPKIIHRTSTTIKDDNLWKTIAQNETRFCHKDLLSNPWLGRINNYISFGGISGYKVDVKNLLLCIRSNIESIGSLRIEAFDYKLLTLQKRNVVYKDYMAKKLIFCEGWKAIHNPYFSNVNLDPAKGEVLKIELANPKIDEILKHKLFIVPQENGCYWVGSSYEWNQKDESPTESKFKFLTTTLKEILQEDFTVVDHIAGIRPTTKTRRPIVHLHPDHQTLAIFNGLGTKGASIAPFFVNKLYELL